MLKTLVVASAVQLLFTGSLASVWPQDPATSVPRDLIRMVRACLKAEAAPAGARRPSAPGSWRRWPWLNSRLITWSSSNRKAGRPPASNRYSDCPLFSQRRPRRPSPSSRRPWRPTSV